MKEEGLNSIVYSKNVIEFITVANEFCSFLERSEEIESTDFMSRLQKLLPLLYLKTSLLPEFGTGDEEEDDLEKFVSEMDYNLIQEKIRGHTKASDDYQDVFVTGMQFSEEALTCSISEDTADIYQEMKDLVMSFRTMNEEVMEQALYEMQNNFAHLWGQKLVNCIRALHNIIYGENNLDDDLESESKQNEKLKNTNRKPDWLNDRFSNQGE
ncbi:MAG TPA: DUF5063 domain-containing protein [Prolixibacteraceae bacterium]|nr:DUF5063 domain-containing protein [Prolixibacteraceae bacterium]